MLKYVVILLLLASSPFVLLALARAVDWLLYWTQQVLVVCPKCHRELTNLYFKCPNCNRVYENLRPNLTHILFVHCACGKLLSTLRAFNRSGAEAVCPHSDCYHWIGPRADELHIVAFPIVGAPASGKTALVMSAIQALTKTIPQKRKWRVRFPFYEDGRYAQRLLRRLDEGTPPDKTNEQLPTAFCVDYETGYFSEPKRLCLYDPAGESFTGQNNAKLQKQIYYRFMSGVVVVVDPLALPGLQARYGKRLERMKDSTHVSDENQNDCVDRLLNLLRNGEPQTLTDCREENPPCALVVTKTDAFDLDKFLGEKAIRAFQKRYGISRLEATDAVCRYWLKEWGGGNIVNTLDAQFRVCRCFSVSAFGKKATQSGSFQPRRVDEPFEWLINVSGIDSRMGKFGVLIFLFCVVVIPTFVAAFCIIRGLIVD